MTGRAVEVVDHARFCTIHGSAREIEGSVISLYLLSLGPPGAIPGGHFFRTNEISTQNQTNPAYTIYRCDNDTFRRRALPFHCRTLPVQIHLSMIM